MQRAEGSKLRKSRVSTIKNVLITLAVAILLTSCTCIFIYPPVSPLIKGEANFYLLFPLMIWGVRGVVQEQKKQKK